MLDALKSLTGGKGKVVQQQTDELGLLIASAREERSAISAMLNTLANRSAKLAPLGKQLEQVADKATGITDRLDEIAKRLTALDDRTHELEDVDKRIQALKDAARGAEQTTLKALGPDGELHKHREAVQHLSSQALQTQAILATLKKERTALEELRGQLRESEGDVKQALGHAFSLKSELDQVRSTATALQQDFTKIRETSREAREDTNAAIATVKEVEQKLGPLAQIHELSQSTEERLNALNALAEHVSHKAKAVESQQQAIEHAVVQSNRVNEMVWSMDVQMGKLNEGLKQAAKAEETLGRIEKLTQETNGQLESAAKTQQEVERETIKLSKEGTTLLDAVRGQVDTLAMKKKELEAFDERVRALQGTVGDAESRVDTLAAKDKHLVALGQKVDGLTKRFEALFGQADELAKKQIALETLNDQLAQVDEAREEDDMADGCTPSKPAGPRPAAEGSPGVLQVARRDRAAARQARRRPPRARGLRGSDERLFGAGAGARGENARHPRADEARRGRHAEGHAPQPVDRRARRPDFAGHERACPPSRSSKSASTASTRSARRSITS